MSLITIESKALKEALAGLAGAIVGNGTLPILGCVRLTTENDALRVHATNLELHVSLLAPAIQADTGIDLCIDAKRLQQICAVTADPLTIRPGKEPGAACTITYTRAKHRVPTLPSADWPGHKWQESDWTHKWDDGGQYLWPMVQRVADFAARHDVRYYLLGAHIDHDPKTGELIAAGTDGHQIAAASRAITTETVGDALPSVKGGHAGRLTCILPMPAAQAMLRHQPQTIRLYATRIEAESTTGTRIVSSLIDGSFPDWRRFVPDKPRVGATRFVVSGDTLESANDRATLACSDKLRGSKWTVSESELQLSAEAPDGSRVDATAEIAEVEHPGRAPVGFSVDLIARLCRGYREHMGDDAPAMPIELAPDGNGVMVVRQTHARSSITWTCATMPMRM